MAYTLEQLKQGIVAADSAGDTASVQTLGAEYRKLQTEIPDVPKTPEEPSFLSQARRAVGLTARAGLEGFVSPVTMVTDVVGGAANALLPSKYQIPSARQQFSQGLTELGVPKPETDVERVVGDVSSAIAGTAGTIGIGKALAQSAHPIAQAISKILTSDQILQLESTIAGSASGSIAKELGAEPSTQMAASIIGGLTPSAISAAAEQIPRSLLRGGKENIPAMKERIQSFRGQNIEPSVAQVTDKPLAKATETAVSYVPGGFGVMEKAAQKEQQQFNSRVTAIADDLANKVSPVNAGTVIEKGLGGESGFVNRVKESQKILYDKVDEFIPKTAPIDASITMNTLKELNADIPTMENLSKFFKNAKIQDIESSLVSDISGKPGGVLVPKDNPAMLGLKVTPQPSIPLAPAFISQSMPYEAAKKLRTLVGNEMSYPSIEGVSPDKWRKIYSSLSKDIEGAAGKIDNANGFTAIDTKGRIQGPASQAIRRANAFTSAYHDRVESVLNKVVGKNNIPEQIFKNAVNPTDMSLGATRINAVMRSLNPSEREVVKSAYLRRMGLTSENKNSFNTKEFLNNWDNMSDSSKSVMFSGKDGKLRSDLDVIVELARHTQTGSKIFTNPEAVKGWISRVEGGEMAAGILAPATVPYLIIGTATAHLGAKAMTSPKIVDWLAKSTKISTASLPSALQNLSRITRNEPDDVKAEVDEFINAVPASAEAERARRKKERAKP